MNDSESRGDSGLPDLDQLCCQTFVRQIVQRSEVGSTNDLALQLLRQDRLQLPALVICDTQTAGRGRSDRRWWSDAGSLTFSLVIEPGAEGVPLQRWPLLSLATAVAICQVADTALPASSPAKIKWPNDVFAAGRKLGGVLIERPAVATAVVVGIGLNVNTDCDAAPDTFRSKLTSLSSLTGRAYDRGSMLRELIVACQTSFQAVASEDADLAAEWQQRCLLSGRTVVVAQEGSVVRGLCQGIQSDGSLAVDTGDQVAKLFVGEVQLESRQGGEPVHWSR